MRQDEVDWLDADLTTTIRPFTSEILIELDDDNGLREASAAQCQHVRAVSTARNERSRGNVGPAVLSRIRATVGLILDIPA